MYLYLGIKLNVHFLRKNESKVEKRGKLICLLMVLGIFGENMIVVKGSFIVESVRKIWLILF